MRIRVDFFRADVMSNLRTIREYLLEMEKQLKLLAETKEALLRAEYKDAEELDIEMPGYKIAYEEIFPRCLRYSFVVFLYSFLETELEAVRAELVKRRSLSKESLRPKVSPLERCRIFLSKHFAFDFGRATAWEDLLTLEKVRDCIVHTGGRIEHSRDRAFLERKSRSHIGFSVSDHPVSRGRLNLEPEFCLSCVDAATTFFDSVFEHTGFGSANLMFET